ncbi:serine carboxypeptidase-like 33 [Malania oleifera]|uniref:serine carboxypeptidase-like 33 n=1 Tax=Malania oleifera TaxID=397392 RepID=UPI0025AE207C|nr:serine carboxypeptidase-like 33 [Malania oleifera]
MACSCSPPFKKLCFSLFFLLASFINPTRIKASSSPSSSPLDGVFLESDRVTNLPGQPQTPSVSHFSGHITVHALHGRSLFYWFFEALSQPSHKPLLLWLNGGPGCSSVGYGAAVELGPLLVSNNGADLHFNNFTWATEANVLFVESPAGVGFSYTNISSDLSMLDDEFVAEDAYNFLVNWLQRFPQFKDRDFFIAGESYAGHYVPQLAELIYERNKQGAKYPSINLKGFIVGNPETDNYYDYKGLLEYAWSHSVISDEDYNKTKQVCDFKTFVWSRECNDAMNVVFEKYDEIDIYNIYAPKCFLNSASSVGHANFRFSMDKVKSYGWRRKRLAGGYDPCYSKYAEEYFNRVDVQSSLHVKNNGNVKWTVCNNSILRAYNFTNFSVLPIYTKLIKGGLRIWIYSGDTDGRVPVIGSRYCIEALGLPLKSPWRSWHHQAQVGGRMVEYEGLTFVTVRGAGHLVPLNKPSHSLSLIHSFLSGDPLP